MFPIPLKDNLSCRVFPLATFILIALNCAAFIVEILVPASQQQAFFQTWAMVPAKITAAFVSGNPLAIGGSLLTVLTAMFLHGGPSHLLGNMIFLQAFGRSVEARLGSVFYAVFYIFGGFAAWGLHMMTDPHSTVPALGASGAIAAVLGAYLVLFPKAEFKTLLIVGVLPILAVIRAHWLLIAWFVMQLFNGIGGLIDPTGGAGVAYWAHIGGFLFGLLIAGSVLLIKPSQDACYVSLSCSCECNDESCPHHGRRFRVLGLNWLRGNRNDSME